MLEGCKRLIRYELEKKRLKCMLRGVTMKSGFTRVLRAVCGYAGNQDQGEKFNGLSAGLMKEEFSDESGIKLAKTPVGA